VLGELHASDLDLVIAVVPKLVERRERATCLNRAREPVTGLIEWTATPSHHCKSCYADQRRDQHRSRDEALHGAGCY
jgi:hypothetical protein